MIFLASPRPFKMTALHTKVKEVEVADAPAGKDELAEISFDDDE